MATLRGSAGLNNTNSSFTITKITGVVSGDVQYAILSCDGSGQTLSISGGATWTQIGATANISNGDTQTVKVFRQIAGGAEPASYTVSAGAASSTAMIAYSGVDNTTPEAASSAISPNTATAPLSPVTMSATPISTTVANQTVIYLASIDWASSSAGAFSDPSGFTLRQSLNPNGQFSNAYLADSVQVATGSTGAVASVATLASTRGNYAAWLIALLDVAAAGDTLMGQACL